MEPRHVGVFWDFENCHPPSGLQGHVVVEKIRNVARTFGSVIVFKAYLELPETSTQKAVKLRSELQSSGVSLTDCPHNGRKDVADKMIIVDMMAFAWDNPAGAVIVLISGDKDFVYCLSILGLRLYTIALIVPKQGAESLKSQSKIILNWENEVLNLRDQTHEVVRHAEPLRPSSSGCASHSPLERALPPLRQLSLQPCSQQAIQRPSLSPPAPTIALTRALETDKLPVTQAFDPLIETLTKQRAGGYPRPSWSALGLHLPRLDPLVYKRAGVTSLKTYLPLAKRAGVVTLGQTAAGDKWVSLNEPYKSLARAKGKTAA